MIGFWRQLLRGPARNTPAYTPPVLNLEATLPPAQVVMAGAEASYADGVAEGRRQRLAELLEADPPARQALVANVVDAAEAWCFENASAGFHGCLLGVDSRLYDAVSMLHVFEDDEAVSLAATEEATP